MPKFKAFAEKIPAWTFTVLTVAIILWCTLTPHPLGEEEIELFPGADKLIHAILFGILQVVVFFDWSRHHDWKNVPVATTLFLTMGVMLFGICTEFMQQSMNLGRTLEIADMAADVTGASLALIIWKIFERLRPE